MQPLSPRLPGKYKGMDSMIKKLFTEHPHSVNETYGEHFGVALSFAAHMAVGSLVCLVHAFLPFLFEKTGSRIVTGLNDRMVAHRVRTSSLAKGSPFPAE